ncbi:hypothetical protein [Taibaiella koreensis]|uniref:hypothetical protein n=1 Tax=Taibaiella koreensis TaxID=1268548 RepID=UPI000E59A651|nr:hypothetical protein [Taibaiella koreensis]
MSELLFSLLALTTLILFLGALVRTEKSTKRKWRLPAAAILFILLAQASIGHNWKAVSFRTPEHLRTTIVHDIYDELTTSIKETPSGNYLLRVHYGRDTLSGRYVPLSAVSFQTGFHYGHVWRPLAVQVLTAPDNLHFRYIVEATREWRLLGMPLYTGTETFNGEIPIPASSKQGNI